MKLFPSNLVALALLMAIALLACSDSRSAGSVSETTNGSISGTIQFPDSAIGLQAKIHLYPAEADPANGSLRIEILPDSNGGFSLEALAPGYYRLIARVQQANLAAYISSIEVNKDSLRNLGTLVLQPVSTLKLDLTALPVNAGQRCWFPGTDLQHSFDGNEIAAKTAWIRDVPRGSFEQLYLSSGNSSLPLLGTPLLIDRDTNSAELGSFSTSLDQLEGFATMAGGTTGGADGDTVLVDNWDSLRTALESDSPLVVLVQGTISGSERIGLRSFKTLLGIGSIANLTGFGLVLDSIENVVIRNLTFAASETDAIGIERGTTHVWVDHCTFLATGDGLIDIKNGSDLITLSWNLFQKNAFGSLIGHDDGNGARDSLKLRTTLHHNWFDSTAEMSPRVRFGQVHIANNLFRGNELYAIASTQYAQVMVEGNWFQGVVSPTVIRHTSSADGALQERDNIYMESGIPATAGVVPEPADSYSMAIDPASRVPALVKTWAGAGKLIQLLNP